jgi:amidase
MAQEVFRDQIIYAMSDSNEAVMTVKSGEKIIFHTEDCFSHEITTSDQCLSPEFDYSRVNPATGPVWIEGAEPGDVLKITIERIELDDQGVVEIYPGWGPLGDRVMGGNTEIVRVKEKAVFMNLELELRPMIGVIGVAPAESESIACGIPGHHGGNLDTLENTEGSILRLPVFVKGAKLALGDLHAVMGNGEVCGTGVEIRGKVTLKIELEKGVKLEDPLLETEDAYYFLASAENIEEAVKASVNHAVEFISREKAIPFEKAYMLASIACDLQISQIVNPLKTVKMKVPKTILK